MTYDFEQPVGRLNTNSEKYDGAAKFAPKAPEESIPLWIADMDFKTAPEIIEGMKRRVESGIFGYTDIYDDSYYEAVCGWMKKKHSWEFDKSEIVLDSGVVPAILHGLSILGKPEGGVIIQTPAYRPFYNTVCSLKMKPVFSPLVNKNGRYEMDFEDLERKAADKDNRVFILCSPHNPTGRVWTEEELRRAMEICRAYKVAVISDEIHGDLVRSGKRHLPLTSLFPAEKRVIVCTSPSKTFNLAGNHLANIMIPDISLREEWERRYHYMPNPISVEATISAYTRAGQWEESLNRYIDGTFEMMENYFRDCLPKVHFRAPEATYLAWIDMREYELSQENLVERFLRNGLIIEGGEQFVADGEGFVRMNVAAPRAVIREALKRMRKAFA